ncbi:MAG: ABC transporter ATP-binding protein [Lentisphaerae bacterium]|jgi:phospholipid/cholesterol/gamma-HCH transport system ATP-binding protein|nr:ABC transporter ATP-binding protein [Lentisphaerota bacterium]
MIEFKGVTKTFGSRKVLDNVSYTVERGEVFVIVGFSGAGKSVSLKHMIRLLTPDEGQVLIDGEPINEATGSDLSRIREKFGLLFQGGALLEWLSVAENVALPLREKTLMSEEEIMSAVREKLTLVGLENSSALYPADISGGMRKRVALARAIVTQPEIILYDEPTSGLDPVTSRNIDKLITDMQKELKVTSVVVTHDLFSALAIGTRIAMIYEGNFIELSEPEKFIKSENQAVKNFLDAQYITQDGPWNR